MNKLAEFDSSIQLQKSVTLHHCRVLLNLKRIIYTSDACTLLSIKHKYSGFVSLRSHTDFDVSVPAFYPLGKSTIHTVFILFNTLQTML